MIWLTSLATLCLGIDLGWRWGSRAQVEPTCCHPAFLDLGVHGPDCPLAVAAATGLVEGGAR